MKIFQLAFTLVMLSLQGSKADKVTSCIQCESLPGKEDTECIQGTGNGS